MSSSQEVRLGAVSKHQSSHACKAAAALTLLGKVSVGASGRAADPDSWSHLRTTFILSHLRSFWTTKTTCLFLQHLRTGRCRWLVGQSRAWGAVGSLPFQPSDMVAAVLHVCLNPSAVMSAAEGR